MSFLNPGCLAIATLDLGGSGAKTATYYLPPPDNDSGLTLEWCQKDFTTDLIDGSESTRRLGWIPELTLNWTVFDDVNARYGYTIGTANGNQLTFPGLLSVLDTTPGYLKICPSLSANTGFVVNKVTVAAIGIIGPTGLAHNVSIVLRGQSIFSTKVLPTF